MGIDLNLRHYLKDSDHVAQAVGNRRELYGNWTGIRAAG